MIRSHSHKQLSLAEFDWHEIREPSSLRTANGGGSSTGAWCFCLAPDQWGSPMYVYDTLVYNCGGAAGNVSSMLYNPGVNWQLIRSRQQ